jgi:ribosomal protein S18 acetylase RimI-like enzyme
MTESTELDCKLLGYLRASAQRRPNSEYVGSFIVTFNEKDNNPYLNYAIPDDGADPSEPDIVALIATFRRKDRKPRLEYMAGAAPRLEAALLAQGFTAEARVPVMLCTSALAVTMPPTVGIEVFTASAEDDLSALEAAQAHAYGNPSHGPEGLKRTLRFGGVVVAARDIASGAVVGGGIATPPLDGVTEIAGIGVRPAFRRRGAAAAITALLAREAFARGIAIVWLTPGSVDAQRIYAGVGFRVASEALHMTQ